MKSLPKNFLPWTKAFHAAGALPNIGNARGFWGAAEGRGGLPVCSVWSDRYDDHAAQAHIPLVNRGGYRDVCLSLRPGDRVVVILRSRQTNQGAVLPTLWAVERFTPEQSHNSVGWLELRPTEELLPQR